MGTEAPAATTRPPLDQASRGFAATPRPQVTVTAPAPSPTVTVSATPEPSRTPAPRPTLSATPYAAATPGRTPRPMARPTVDPYADLGPMEGPTAPPGAPVVVPAPAETPSPVVATTPPPTLEPTPSVVPSTPTATPTVSVLRQSVVVNDPGLAQICNTDATTFTLTWSAVSGAESYRAQASSSGFSQTVTSSGPSAVFNCPTATGPVTFTVVGINGIQESEPGTLTVNYPGPMDSPMRAKRARR